ncbi:MAG: hypothetical protein ACTH58_07805 [Marinomonas foliarum]|uniref:hypothetical protein n=1 Tax=Marinomonas foliarum TaxID=491950 RepID=UPI003F94EC92
MDYPDSPDLFEGKFTDGDPVAGIPASVASADHMNAVYDELKALIAAGGIVPGAADLAQVAKSIGNQLRSKQLFDVSGTANAIILTSPAGKQPVTTLNDYDEFSFVASATNTGLVTIKIDSLAAMSLAGVVSDTQIFETALLTVRYIAGSFYIANQINPKTGNPVALIGEIISSPFAGLGACKMRFDSGELSRATHPILFAKAQKTGLVAQALKDADLTEYGGKWGDGDGITTFTVPIYDGVFLRYADNGRGVDVGRELGSWQDDAMLQGSFHIRSDAGGSNLVSLPTGSVSISASNGSISVDGNSGGATQNLVTIGSATETRPMNYAVNAEFLV